MPAARKRVLVVDDEHAIADTLALILTHAGYESSATYSGDTAVALAQSLQPDLVISDIQMPGLDGISAAIAIRELHPGCRIMLFSGHPEAHVSRAEAHGLNVLPKPLAPEFLLERIHDQLHSS